MNVKISLAAVAAIAALTPAAVQAQSTGGAHPYIGAQVGYHELTDDSGLDIEDNGFIYGLYGGVDFDLSPSVIVGIEGNANMGTNAIDAEYGVAGRLGYRTSGDTILYVRGGYQWVNVDVGELVGGPVPANIDDTVGDYLVGAGADFGLGGSGARVRLGVDTIAFDSIRPTVGISYGF